MTDAAVERLVSDEAARGEQLIASGHIVRIWRIPGRRENVGIWRCRDATELHALLESLPAFPYFTASATALATHPLEAGRDDISNSDKSRG